MAQRFNWNAPQSEQTEPQNKDWDEFDYVPAQVLNWAWTLIEKNFEGINKGMLIGPNVDEGNLKDPFKVGSGGVYRGGYSEGGVAFYTAFNCKWTGSDWEEIDDTKGDPALIAHNVTDASQLDGISASDVYGDEWVFLRALTVDSNNIITWEIAPINISSIFNLTIREVLKFGDRDSDDFHWKFTEDPSTGHLHIKHPEIPTGSGEVGDVKIRQDGTIISANSLTVTDGEQLIAGLSSDGASSTGSFDIKNDGNIPDYATSLLLKAWCAAESGTDNAFVQIRHAGQSNYQEVAAVDQNEANISLNTFWYPLDPSDQIEYSLKSGQLSELRYLGYKS